MGINNTRLATGARRFMPNTGNAGATEQRSAAQFWLNIGYETGHEKYDFISLPKKGMDGERDKLNGIPLNLEDILDVRGNSEYSQVLAAQNELLEDIIEAANEMNPGETVNFPIPDFPIPGICLQLRRIADQTATVDKANNSFSRRNMQAAQAEAPAAE